MLRSFLTLCIKRTLRSFTFFFFCKICNFCMTYETIKNAVFFYKEWKRMQRTFRSFIKNGNESKNVAFFWKERMPNPAYCFQTFSRFVFGSGSGKCPHFPTSWQFYSQTTTTLVADPTMTVTCSSGSIIITKYQCYLLPFVIVKADTIYLQYSSLEKYKNKNVL